ncbi:DUF4097 family beta strand repeat-containing protein [Actinophytocola oryzae]|uniref:Putative adhesin n=1 Tax=Actinophytocola oryzae TaxID=502181 RepID=A0A4R7VHA5_9PSEU|nr:DUF4097 family beta strand repeat-containing protein [Actinophytocola oryzae]TDV48716.1 putative adhesin [Actinophytocola oryzae]
MYTFNTPTPITTTLDLPAGSIRFVATDRTDTTVEIQPANTTKNSDIKAAKRTTVDYTDNILRIHTPAAANQLLGPTGALTITVALPTGSHIQARTDSAELDTTGRLGNLTFNGAYHHINIDETASLHLTAIDGDIHIHRVNGPADITTTRGDITLTEAVHGTVVLRTEAGNISVGVAEGASATLDAGTTHGRINNTLTNTTTPQLTIHATTAYGDILAHSL